MVSPWTPESFGMVYEELSIKTKDGLALRAWYIPSKKASKDKAVILCHGYPADKGNILGIAEILTPYYNIFMFDFRAMGKSGGKVSTIGYREVNDYDAAVEYLKERGVKEIGAYGFSMGGAVAIMSNNPDVKAIVTESAFADIRMVIDDVYAKFGVFKYPFIFMTELYAKLFLGIDFNKKSPAKSIREINVPILLIHSEDDSTISVKHANILHDANPKSSIFILKKAGHGELVNQKEYRDKIISFFRDNL